MKLTVRCRSGLRIDFEGSLEELERFDGFLSELARLERDRLAPGRTAADDSSDHSCDRSGDCPTPSPPSTPELDAEPADAPRPEDDSPVPAVDPPTPPARVPSPRAGGRGRTTSDDELALETIGRLAVCSKRELVAETGIPDSTLTAVLSRLIDAGQVIATGATTARRFRLATGEDTSPADEQFAAGIDALSRAALSPAPGPEPDDENDVEAADPEPAPPVVRRQQSPHEGRVIGAGARAAMDAQRDERHDQHRQQIVALVAEHGPVSFSWVADQLVKNRRDTAALMRAMAAAGELVDQGGYFNVPDGDEEARAA